MIFGVLMMSKVGENSSRILSFRIAKICWNNFFIYFADMRISENLLESLLQT